MQVLKKVDSKLLGRQYVEFTLADRGGKLSRKDAVAELAKELGVSEESVGLIRLEEQSGKTAILGRAHVYGTKESRQRLHPKYLDERSLTKEEKEKLRQERKKAKTPAPAAEAKK